MSLWLLRPNEPRQRIGSPDLLCLRPVRQRVPLPAVTRIPAGSALVRPRSHVRPDHGSAGWDSRYHRLLAAESGAADERGNNMDNPMCSCDPCTCAECACGVVTLGDLERRVLGIVWDLPDPEPTGREVADALPAHAYTTIATVLDRLVNKGLLSRRRDGRTIRFAPIGVRGAHTAVVMHQALEADGNPTAALAVSQTRCRPRRLPSS